MYSNSITMVSVKEVQRKERKEIIMTIRTTKENAHWMNTNKVSPSILFDKALKELKENTK